MPTISAQSGAGTGATASFSNPSTDRRGQVTLVTGSGSYATGAQLIVLFDAPIPTAPAVVISAANATAVAADQLQFYVASGTASWTLNAGIADDESNTYVFDYVVQG